MGTDMFLAKLSQEALDGLLMALFGRWWAGRTIDRRRVRTCTIVCFGESSGRLEPFAWGGPGELYGRKGQLWRLRTWGELGTREFWRSSGMYPDDGSGFCSEVPVQSRL